MIITTVSVMFLVVFCPGEVCECQLLLSTEPSVEVSSGQSRPDLFTQMEGPLTPDMVTGDHI